jgi:nucleotide sugar dehydrogenase
MLAVCNETQADKSIQVQKVGVVGVGYVGIHLVTTFAKKYQVVGYDISPKRVHMVRKELDGWQNILVDHQANILQGCDLFLISVPTLIKENSVDHSYLKAAIETVSNYATIGSTVVMESSVAVGMTRNLLEPLFSQGVHVGFSPERVDPGREDPQSSIAKVVSGYDRESLKRVIDWYSPVFDEVVPVSSLETAEMCKLYENCFRMINIAYVNEIADACFKKGIDVDEMIQASATKPFGFLPFYPGLGVGGHCIPINPYYLFANNQLPLLSAATKVTERRPIEKAQKFRTLYPLFQTILVIGIGFKYGQSCIDNSPGLAFADELRNNGQEVILYDPLVNQFDTRIKRYDFITKEQWNDHEWLNKRFDCVFIAMKQKGIDWSKTKDLYIPVVYGNRF